MTFGLNNLNIFNANGYGNMFGMTNMFGIGNMCGSSYGSSIFGMGYGCSPFMDSNGYINYDAMAGVAVGNVLVNCAGLAINYAIANRAGGTSKESANATLNENLDKLLSERETIIENSGTTAEAILGYNKVSSAEYKAWDTANKAYQQKAQQLKDGEVANSSNEQQLTEVSKLLASPDITAEQKATLEANKSELVNAITAYNTLKEKVAEAKIELETKKEALDEQDKKMTKAKTDLEAVDKKIKNAREAINKQILDNADGKKSKHRNEDLDLSKYKAGQVLGDNEKIQNTTQKDIAQLIYLFRKTDDTNTKRNYAQAINNIDNAVFLKVASNDQVEARKIIKKWLEENPKTTT